jgi:hypothetical protein
MSWPPPPTPPPSVTPRPWEPNSPLHPSLGGKDTSRLRYIVVDELIGDWAGLSVSRWPDADQEGRLRFDLTEGEEVGVGVEELRGFLGSSPGAGRGGSARAVRVGTVFAAELKEGDSASHGTRLEDRFENPCDITVEARKVAKLAHYGAVARKLLQEEAQDWELDEFKE